MDRSPVIYEDTLLITATLTLSSGSYAIAGSNVLDLDVHLRPWGFDGSMTFLVMAYPSTDGLLTAFQASAPIPIALTVVTGNEGVDQSTCVPLSLKGMVSERRFIEIAGNQQASTIVSSNPVFYRRYFVRFEDSAHFYWKQHYFQGLYANSTYQTIINAQKPSSVTLNINWTVLTTSQLQIFVNSGASASRNPTASFFDWLMWLVDTNNGYYYYNYSNSQYNLVTALPAASTTTSLSALTIGTFWIKPAEPKLSTLTIYNATASGSSTKSVSNTNAAAPLATCYTTIQPIANNFTSYTTLQTNRFQGQPMEISWDYLTTPTTMLVPWNVVQFTSSSNNISSSSALSGQTLRITSVDFSCSQLINGAETNNYGNSYAGYKASLQVGACTSSTTLSMLPDYQMPVYPVEVQGTVCSTQGSTTNLTYSYATPSGSTVNFYTVQIPVWSNVQIQVPYMPVNMNGQFYFPPYRNEQILVSLGLNTADILSYIDWRTNATPALTSQGNVIVMGQSETSCTTITHSYSNNQPQLEINRVLSTDTETITIGEGFILLQTEQTPSS